MKDGTDSLRHKLCLNNGNVDRSKIEDIYSSVLEQMIMPYRAVSAIQALVRSALKGECKKNVAILSGRWLFFRKPAVVRKGKALRARYQIKMFGHNYDLGTYLLNDVGDGRMAIEMSIDGDDKITFKTKVGRSSFDRVFKHPDLEKRIDSGFRLLGWRSVDSRKFDRLCGVSVKKAQATGHMSIGGNMFNFGKDYAGRYVFTFFNEGKTLFFDDHGEQLFTTLSAPEVKRQRANEKMFRILAKYRESGHGDYSRRAAEYIENAWQKHPESFEGYGKRILVEGSTRARTSVIGAVSFMHMRNGKAQPRLYADWRLPVKPVLLRWNGPYSVITDLKGKLINANKVATPGFVSTANSCIDELAEAVSIKGMRYMKQPKVTINNVIYFFDRNELASLASGLPEDASIAVMSHIRRYAENEFYLLARYAEQFCKQRINCVRKKG